MSPGYSLPDPERAAVEAWCAENKIRVCRPGYSGEADDKPKRTPFGNQIRRGRARPGYRPSSLTLEQRSEVRRLRAEGATISHIAQIVGLSAGAIHNIINPRDRARGA